MGSITDILSSTPNVKSIECPRIKFGQYKTILTCFWFCLLFFDLFFGYRRCSFGLRCCLFFLVVVFW